MPVHDRRRRRSHAQRQPALARLKRVELAEFGRHLRQVDALGWHAAAAGFRLRDLQQRCQCALHTFEILERRLQCLAGGAAGGRALQRGFQPCAHAIQRRAQVVRRAIEGDAHRGRLLLDTIEHAVHGAGELVEFVGAARRRQPARQVSGDDAVTGLRHRAHARRQPAAEPPAGDRDQRRRQSGTPQGHRAQALRKSPALGNICADQQPVAVKRDHRGAHRVADRTSLLVDGDVEFAPRALRFRDRRPQRQVAGQRVALFVDQQIGSTEAAPIVGTLVEHVDQALAPAATIIFAQRFDFGFDHQVDLALHGALGKQVDACEQRTDAGGDAAHVPDRQPRR